jgi:hypothetical protein
MAGSVRVAEEGKSKPYSYFFGIIIRYRNVGWAIKLKVIRSIILRNKIGLSCCHIG